MSPVQIFAASLVLLVIALALWRLLYKRPKPKAADFPATWRPLLSEKVMFYHELPKADKTRFEESVLQFLDDVRVTGVGTEVEDVDRLLVAASAVIPLFGFPGWRYRNIDEVLLYEAAFNQEYDTQDGEERNILGMVGGTGMNRTMILSKPALHQGFAPQNSKHNVGIHEFVHLLDRADGASDGMPESLLRQPFLIPWVTMMQREMEAIQEGKSEINPYASTNQAEFLSVVSEYFFQQPELLQKHHPELFGMLEKIFRPALLWLFFFGTASVQAQIHLGPNQSYANIQAAASILQPGDTVYLHAGNYAGYQVVTDLKGTADQGIVITRYQQDSVHISGGWQFVRCAYLQFLGLNFEGDAAHPGRLFSVDNGGSCSTQSNHILVRGCSFSNTTDPAASVAFKFAGVDYFEVSNNVFANIPACEAMSYNTCHEGLIQGNRFENCLSGGHIKGGSSNITLEKNLFINASQSPWVAYELGGDTGAPFYCPGDSFEVKNLKFYANIIVGGYRGLALSSARDCKVINNTFYQCGQATMRFLTTSNFYPMLSGNLVENNLFSFGTSAYINGGPQPAGAVTFSHNIYYSTQNDPFNGPYWDTPALDAIIDPSPLVFGAGTMMFVDGPGYDFHLPSGSPAIGSGKTQTEPVTDFYGHVFSASAPTIGAIAAAANTEIVEPDAIPVRSSIQVYPNPATEHIQVLSGEYQGLLEVWTPTGLRLLRFESGQTISIAHLPSGVYFLRAGVFILPFVKI